MPVPTAAGGQARPPLANPQSIATSNRTVSAFLGGRALKSWMTGASEKPTSNRPPPVPRQPATHVVQQQSSQSVLPSPAPSDEPSPAVSNPHDSPNPNPAVLPEAPTMGETTSASGPPLAHPVTEARFIHDLTLDSPVLSAHQKASGDSPLAAPSNQSAFTSNNQVSTPVGGGTRASPVWPNAGSYISSPVLTSGPDGTPNTCVPPTSFFQGGSPQALASPLAYPGSFVPPVLSGPPPRLSGSFHGSPSPVASSPINQQGSFTPRSVSGPSGGRQASGFYGNPPQGVNIVHPPNKRRRTDAPQYPRLPLSSLSTRIDLHVRDRGGDQALLADIDKPRLQLLKEACAKGDVFFLSLHQLFCIWTRSSQTAHDYIQLQQQLVDRAFHILETVLKKNQMVSGETLTFFTDFPAPINQLLDVPTEYALAVSQVAKFLEKLATGFQTVTGDLVNRRFPYLADELVTRLGCQSPILQVILFTACRRRLGVMDGPLGSKMDKWFREDQRRYQESSSASTPSAIEDMRKWKRDLSKRYQEIVLTATGFSANPPGMQSAVNTSTQVPDNRHGDYAAVLRHSASGPSLGQAIPNPHYIPGNSSGGASFPATAFPHPQPIVPSHGPRRQPMSEAAQQQQQLQGQYLQQLQRQHLQNLPREQPQAQAEAQVEAQSAAQLRTLVQARAQAQAQAQALQAQQVRNSQLGSPSVPQLGGGIPSQFLRSPAPHLGPVTASHQPILPAPPLQMRQYIPTIVDVPTATNRQVQYTSQTAQMAVKWSPLPLLPPEGTIIAQNQWPYEPSDKKAILMALHQAHLSSPKRVTKSGTPERFYQAIKSLVTGPVLVPAKNVLQTIHFDIPEPQFSLASRASRAAGELRPVVVHFNGSLRWRLRACKANPRDHTPSEQQWATSGTDWPPNIFIMCNGTPLEIRRETHNGKDQPIELTELVISGRNTVDISLPPISNGCFIAVEMLETLSHSETVKLVWNSGLIPEEQTLQTIRKRLTPPADDDGIIIEEPNLSIDLADPFTAVIFKVPARGVDCTHMECFDLETWLNTRPSKPAEASSPDKWKEPSYPDKWKCPICGKDARPYSLRIDGFLLKVRAQLEQENKLQSKSMHVKPDGTWTPVVEVDVGSDDDDDDQPSVAGRSSVSATARRQEVIELE